MKKEILLALSLFFFLFLTVEASGQKVQIQQDRSDVKVQDRTLMERFEPGLVYTPEERIRKKRNRMAAIAHTKCIIDTLDISDRKRRRLLKDLKDNPFSTRLSKVLAENRYEE